MLPIYMVLPNFAEGCLKLYIQELLEICLIHQNFISRLILFERENERSPQACLSYSVGQVQVHLHFLHE